MAGKLRTSEDDIAALSAGQRRAILDVRARQLARRGEDVAAAPHERVLLCAVGPNLYGLPLEQVSKIRSLERRGAAPARDPALLGLVTDNGEVRPALDLGALLGGVPAPGAGGWLILLAPPHKVALRADALPEAVDIAPLDAGQARIVGGEHHDKILVRLSAGDLLASHIKPLHGAPAP